jgi:chaperonin GroEL
MQYQKVKSVSKAMLSKGSTLTQVVLETAKSCSDLVGATLGPGGMPVLIERQELNLPAMVTKDGVTVFRALGYDSSIKHVIMETMRDASIRTASEAGDGTTTAIVLGEAIVRYTNEYVKAHPKVSKQKVVRRMMDVFKTEILPMFNPASAEQPGLARCADMSTEEGRKLLWDVAKISANGDTELADAVLNCFDLVGDEGNVTITEISGPSGFEVEKIEGYPIPVGYEDSCGKYGSKFLNDPANMRTVLEEPVFVVYHGRITEIQSIQLLMERIGEQWQSEQGFRHNVVLVATGFSESVLAQLAGNFVEMTSINVFPLLAPMSNVPGGQLGFLEDICTVTGSRLLDMLNAPMDKAEISDLGQQAKSFESNRFRSVILTPDSEDLAIEVEAQVQKLQQQKKQAASILDEQFYDERIGKLTGGIAKLKVVGASSGELRERRDRAEDAICAVRGAIRKGCLPGGGWMLLKIADKLMKLEDEVITQVLCRALLVPIERLLVNCGMNEDETQEIIKRLCTAIVLQPDSAQVYDAYNQKFVDAWEDGVLDSTPAVLEALRNSLSIASQLGILGGVVAFKRDADLERHEAKETNSFLRDADYAANPADERGL